MSAQTSLASVGCKRHFLNQNSIQAARASLNQGCPLSTQYPHRCNPSGLEPRLISAFSQGGAHVGVPHLLCRAIHEQLCEGGWIRDASALIGRLTMVCVWEGFFGRLPASGSTRRGRSLASSPPAPFNLSLLRGFIYIFIFIHVFPRCRITASLYADLSASQGKSQNKK